MGYNIYGFFLITVFYLTCTLFCLTAGQADNLGTEFLVVFMRNEVEEPLNVPLELFVTTPRTIPVQITVTTQGYTEDPVNIRTTVVSGQVEKIELSYLLRLRWVQVENKVIYIQADNEIAVYGLNKERFSTDGFLVYPTDVIGYEYYTVSHTPTNSYALFALASKFDNTHISMTFPELHDDIPIKIEYGNRVYTNNDVLNITLDAFQSFQCLTLDNADLTGTHIVSNLPVAAFSGNVRTWVGPQTSRDHLATQLPPVQAYGKVFPIIPTPGRSIGDVVRVVSSVENTQLSVVSPTSMSYTIPSAGSYVDFIIPSNVSTTVTSSEPVMVVQIVQSQEKSTDEKSDPTMSIVTAMSQYMFDFVFSTPQYYNGGSYDNWLMLAAYRDDVSGLMFDNRPLAELHPVWSPLPGTDLVGTQLRIEEGPHAVRHISPVARFSGYLYGTAEKESYSFQIGTRMAPINQPCVPTDSLFGDGKDNDCDGVIDEELCTGTSAGSDTDGDGLINEDCAINREIGEGVPDSGGKQFVLFFMDNIVEAPQYLPLEVYVTPLRAPLTTVQIESPRWFEPSIYQKTEVTFGNVDVFYIPYTMRETGTGMTSKALFITSDQDITVYAINKERYSADAFLALPIDVLGKEYYTITHWPNSDSSQCQIGVIGISDGTLVDITFSSILGNRAGLQVEYNGRIYGNDDTMSVVMNRYSTLQLQSRGDMSGTHIKSTQRVAVMSGNIRTSVGSGSSRDHLVAMLPPTESWGKLYCTVPIPGRSTGDYFYVLAAENDTYVQVTSKESFTLAAGESKQLVIPSIEHVAIQSDKPVLVTQLSQSQQNIMEKGDPTMIILPSAEQWANAYTFSTPASNPQGGGNYESFVIMVCPDDQVSGLLFDGQFIPELFTTWFEVSGTNYTGTSFMIQQGAHTLQHVDPTVTFSVIVYGNTDKESYGFAAGMRLARINTPCEIIPSLRGDGIDNDCDGRIDEEICDGEKAGSDMDGDGAFDEDCAMYVPVVTLPTTQATSPFTGTTTPSGPVVGIAGPPGPPGAVGSPGALGNPGVAGYNGVPGNPGLDGLDGADGAEGKVGATGATGASGVTGAKGPLGVVGATGPTGLTGPAGLIGMQGVTGEQGAPGLSIRGDVGADGVVGATGPFGAKGVAGSTGITGPKGVEGQTGEEGQPGTDGVKGIKGDMGPIYLDENECQRADNPCSHGCVNTIGSFYCTCSNGYTLDSMLYNCIDTDECSQSNGGCLDVCVNTVGSFYCECTEVGYIIANDGETCVDANECVSSMHNCTEGQSCVNTMGSHICVSMECLLPPEPTITPPDLTPCPDGRETRVETGECVDIDECAVNNGGCTDICMNLIGSFYCSCSMGYTLGQDGLSCVDVDECAVDSNDCSESELCINTVGSFHCFLPTPDCSNVQVAQVSAGSAFGAVDTGSLVDGDVMLGLFVWLVILTVLFLCFFIWSCKQCRDQDTERRHHVNNIQDIYRSIKASPNIPYQGMNQNSNETDVVTGATY